MKRTAILIAFLMTAAAVPHAQIDTRKTAYTLLDLLVFGTWLEVDEAAYPPDTRTLIRQHLARWKTYQPRQRPDNLAPVMGMVFTARENYERRLVAATSEPGAERLAREFVDALRPCYEWEGFHNCPEAEAKFADQYRAQNPNSPFREFLPLLIAHRWLCAADGYEYEEQPKEAARSRRASEEPLATALKSQSLLIRTAAQELKARGRCLTTPDP